MLNNLNKIQERLNENNTLDTSIIKKIYLLGSTGAGKTSLVRNIIDTVKYNFPATSQSRTTIATTEYIIKKNLPLKTTIILKEKEEIEDSIKMLILEAINKAIENKKIIKKILKILL